MDKPISRKMITAAYVFAAAIGLLMMTSLTSLLFAAKRDPGFPRLAENLAASETLEVRRQIKGEIRGMLALPARQEVIVVADDFLWRFSADGRLLETHQKPGYMHLNGVSFGPDEYWDWIHTGTREHKRYARVVDGNDLDQAGLEAALAQARIVAFDTKDGRAWAYFWNDGQAWKMDISSRRD
jgi:hypothetical protein